MPERRLPIGYYVDNFEIVLKTATEHYDDLLSTAEWAFFHGFFALSPASKRLYVRLISRKGPLFRRDRLDYPEIPELDAAAAELVTTGFLDRGEDASVEALLALLLRPELANLLRDLSEIAAGAARKDELAGLLLETVEPSHLLRSLRERLAVLRPRHEDHVEIFRLLFFGNLRQGWTEFVLRDLGVVRFEPYPLRRDLRLFADRDALDHSLLLRQLREVAHIYLDLGLDEEAFAVADIVLARSDEYHPSTHRLRDRILNHVGRCLERQGELERALELYAAAQRPPARERRARVLARLGRHREALELCSEIADSHRDETEAAFAPRFRHQMRRQLGEKPAPIKRPRRPLEERTLKREAGAAIETVVLRALEQEGRAGFFSENWLWNSLFGLAFWDVVFSPVDGAFQHPFQYGPLDLGSPEFRRKREDVIAARLAELRAEAKPSARLMTVYDAKRDTANRLVAWNEDSRSFLELALAHLSGRHLATVCDRLSRDLRRFRRGFPDLFVIDEAREPGFRLVEVKGPGDQLRPEQGAWIDYLNAHGIPASVLRVRWG